MFQIVGSFLDILLMFAFGIVIFVSGPALIGKEGTEAERKKKLKVLRIVGAILTICGIGLLLVRLVDS